MYLLVSISFNSIYQIDINIVYIKITWVNQKIN